jgi:uncharacterized protein (DUF1800 family)
MNHTVETMIATNRFGLGARPGEAAGATGDPRNWLQQQLADRPGSALTEPGLRSSESAISDFFKWREERKASKSSDPGETGKNKTKAPVPGSPRNEIAREIEARTGFAITTRQPFRERLVRFWSNHFTVSVKNNRVAPVAGAFEREAIRPHVTGNFKTMLLAAETHQAMLFYLDNFQSVGPNSVAGKRRGRGLNENQAREILELHTLGVDGGYSQEDVIELAKALTGWTVSSPRDKQPTGTTWFDPRRHQPGSRKVLGKRYAEAGASQAKLILHDLAARPQTANFIATKLARHFISDDPPQQAVEKLAGVFRESGGHLGQVSAALVNLDPAWNPDLLKFKTPDEFMISSLRGLGMNKLQKKNLRASYAALGQMPFSAPSPAGWPDEAGAWLGPDAVQKRFEWSDALASKTRDRVDPRIFLSETLGDIASKTTRFTVNGADSREQGLTLALMSPEFQRR